MATIRPLNRSLHRANKAKKDEFYTQLTDIEEELRHYKEQFCGKVVYCNCDDPYESNFFKYFANNFNALKLKKLITTSYTKSPIVGQQLLPLDMEGLKPDGKEPYVTEINEVPDINLDGAISLEDVRDLLKHNKNASHKLKGDIEHTAGDFRSKECVSFLEQADIVVTNPPFSLFREYVGQLVKHQKKFLILGQQGAIIYKEIIPLIRDNKIWLGYNNGGTKWFQVPSDYEIETESRKKIVNNIKYFSMGSVNWFTNLDVAKRHEWMTLYKKYSPDNYPKYDNYDAINVNYKAEIPMDYDGVMGVPITFLDNYNPEQFDIIGLDRYTGKNGDKDFTINGKLLFRRLLIRRKAK